MAHVPTDALDAFDLAILDILQRDSTVPQRTIAEAVHLSPPAVQRRIRRLRDGGFIRAEVAVLEPARLGRGLTLLVEVQVHDDHPQRTAALRERLLAEPAVQQCYYITGDADFLLVITAVDMAEYERLTERLFSNDSNVQRFKTSVALNSLKTGQQIPLPTPGAR